MNNFMTFNRYEEPIDTIQQLVAKGNLWGGTAEAYVYSLELATQKDIVNLLKLFKVLTIEELLEHISTSDYSYAIERLQYGMVYLYFKISYKIKMYIHNFQVIIPFLKI